MSRKLRVQIRRRSRASITGCRNSQALQSAVTLTTAKGLQQRVLCPSLTGGNWRQALGGLSAEPQLARGNDGTAASEIGGPSSVRVYGGEGESEPMSLFGHRAALLALETRVS